MSAYYVNNTAQWNGDHEVHEEGCHWLSLASNTSFLGYFDHCSDAVAKSKRDHHQQSNGCATCSRECHTG